MESTPIILVHGGAGDWPKNLHKAALKGVNAAAERGFEALSKSSPALDAVQEAVVDMEDNPLFNAGTGSALNFKGQVEDDAAIMEGESLRGAGVALLRNIKNPVKVARLVLDHTDHVLLGGPNAERFALQFGMSKANLRTSNRIKAWRTALREFQQRQKSKDDRWSRNRGSTVRKTLGDTVGAIALDSNGHLAAADSTGGMQLKLPGRIGDSPVLGAGIYADRTGAAAMTGIGEHAMRLCLAKTACMMMTRKNAKETAYSIIQLSKRYFGPGIGVITLDREGSYGVSHSTRNLCWSMFSQDKTQKGMIGQRVSGK